MERERAKAIKNTQKVSVEALKQPRAVKKRPKLYTLPILVEDLPSRADIVTQRSGRTITRPIQFNT